jgi:hypothetical protein
MIHQRWWPPGQGGWSARGTEELDMYRWPAGVILGLVAASTALGQSQRAFTFPQRTRVGGGASGLLTAMCLDPQIIGAPGTGDPVTVWEHPEAIVVHRLRDGQVVGTQRGSEVLQGPTPWVRFEGASNIAGHVALRAIAVRPEAGVTYEVQILEGTAAARPQEGLSGLYLGRLAEFDGSYGVITRELQELHAAFPPDALLTRLFEAFAQQTLYPAMSANVPARELESAARRFLMRLDGACQTVDAEAQALLAGVLASTGAPTAAQRAFFERHGVSWDDVELSDEERATAERFQKAYAETIFQGCGGICHGERVATAAGLTLARRGMERLVAWQRAGVSCDGPDAAYALGPAFKVTFRNGEPLLGRDTGLTAVNLTQLVRRGQAGHAGKRGAHNEVRPLGLFAKGPPLPAALSAALQEQRWLIDVRGLKARELETLQRRLDEFEKLTGVAYTMLASEDARERLAGEEVRVANSE